MKKSSTWLHTSQTLALLLIMFIDGVGISLVLPLIGDLFSKGSHSLLSEQAPHWLNQFYYGASLASFSIAMIFGAGILGQLSDKHGRKLVLNLSLLGSFIGYVICAFAVILKLPLFFILGRVIDGLTAGSIPVAQATLSDMDHRTNKMTSIGRVMFAVTSGYMLGPVIASTAFIGQAEMLYLPFFLVGLSCLLSIGLLSLIPENKPTASDPGKFQLFNAFKQIYVLFQIGTLRSALFSFFLFQCAWTLFYQYIPKFQLAGHSINASNINLLMALVGAAMCFAFCLAVPKVQNKLSPIKLINACFIAFCLLALSLLSSTYNFAGLTGIAIGMALFYAVGYSAMLGFLMSIANDSEKGLILGSVASICAISATVTAALGGYLNAINQLLFLSVLLVLGIGATLLFVNASYKHATQAV